ncbi:MAG: prepilin-type N-terminal cleavage/methylation domain-containing protein [Synergistaceae bacterium]|nr:prepilin-type N-terminal cleavage/methylation domain-containing protein [Synergistaceae bacterium]
MKKRDFKKRYFRRAFSLVEVMIAVFIMSILGSVATGVLWFAIGMFSQLDDYTSANMEMEFALQKLSREFTLIGLGMPNNRGGQGSFAAAFAYPANPPIMSLMGASGDLWGGPVSITASNPENATYDATTLNGAGTRVNSPRFGPGAAACVGPELYYVWGVPTGVKGRYNPGRKERGEKIEVRLVSSPSPGSAVAFLRNFRHDGRMIGLQESASPGRDPATWFVFPTLRVPLLLDEVSGDILLATLAPKASRNMQGMLTGLDEIHLIQAARLFRNERDELVQIVFGSDYADASTGVRNVLAHNVVGLQFVYNPVSRALTMYIASRGNERDNLTRTGTGQPSVWPSWLPRLASGDLAYRISVKSVTWRIRN